MKTLNKKTKTRNEVKFPIHKWGKVALVIMMLATSMCFLQLDNTKAVSTTKKTIMTYEQAKDLLNPISDEDLANEWQGNYLSWGNDTSHKWQILSMLDTEYTGSDPGVLILSGSLGKTRFDPSSSVYETSELKTYIDNKHTSILDVKEQNVTLNSVNTGGSYEGYDSGAIFNEAKFTAKWFAPTGKIFNNTAYGFPSSSKAVDKSRMTNIGEEYWLSSAFTGNTFTSGLMVPRGGFRQFGCSSSFATRAATNIDAKSVLFVSNAQGFKAANQVASKTLLSVEDSTTNEWKLTIKDATQTLDVSNIDRVNKDEVSFDYTAAGNGNSISAIIKDADGNIIQYGKIATSRSGNVSVLFPVELEGKGYTLQVFSEQLNGDLLTDYASELKTITVPHTHTPSSHWSKDDTNHWHECIAIDGEKMDVAAHTYGDWVIDTPATETTKGSKYRECSVCGQRQIEEIPIIENPSNPNNPGNLVVDVENDTPIEIQATKEEIKDAVLTEKEKQEYLSGTDVNIKVVVKRIPETTDNIVKDALNGRKDGAYFDIAIYKKVGNQAEVKVNALNKTMRFVIDVPEELYATKGVTRVFEVMRIHDGKIDFLKDLDLDDKTVTIETDRFSTYVLCYKDSSSNESKPSTPNEIKPSNPTKPSSPDTGDTTNIALWSLMLLTSIGVVMGTSAMMRRNKKEK